MAQQKKSELEPGFIVGLSRRESITDQAACMCMAHYLSRPKISETIGGAAKLARIAGEALADELGAFSSEKIAEQAKAAETKDLALKG